MRDPLYENKLIALVLVAALIIFGAPLIVDRIFLGHNPYRHAESAPEAITDPAEPSIVESSFAERYAAASAASGERSTVMCKACHPVEKGAPAGVGPNLWGVVGRRTASFPEFSYSAALLALDQDWSPEEIDKYLENSQGYAPGTYMAQRISNPDQRAAIIKYLATLSDTPPTE